jgi:hypothetical protein
VVGRQLGVEAARRCEAQLGAFGEFSRNAFASIRGLAEWVHSQPGESILSVNRWLTQEQRKGLGRAGGKAKPFALVQPPHHRQERLGVRFTGNFDLDGHGNVWLNAAGLNRAGPTGFAAYSFRQKNARHEFFMPFAEKRYMLLHSILEV